MKKKEIAAFLALLLIYSNGFSMTREGHEEDPHYEWFEGYEVAVQEDGIYTDSNKGLLKLNVVEYDRGNDRYKVLCSCLKKPYLDPAEALAAPYEEKTSSSQTNFEMFP